MILDEHGLDDLARHARPDIEVDGQTLQELPFPCVDLPIGKQKIGDDGERRQSRRSSRPLECCTCNEPIPIRLPSPPISAAPPQNGCAGAVKIARSSRYSQ